MNWDSALLTTKVFLYLAAGLLLGVANAVTASVVAIMGAVVCAAGGYPVTGYLVAAASFITLYSAGRVGRDWLTVDVLPRLMFTDAEIREVDRVATEEKNKK